MFSIKAGRRAANSAAAAGAGGDPASFKHTPASAGRQILVRAAGRIVGIVRDGVFSKRLRASVHFLRQPPAIAFDVSSLDQAARAGAVRVEVLDAESGRVYSATIAEIRARGFPVERGFGPQVALPLHRWRVTGAPRPDRAPEVRQLELEL